MKGGKNLLSNTFFYSLLLSAILFPVFRKNGLVAALVGGGLAGIAAFQAETGYRMLPLSLRALQGLSIRPYLGRWYSILSASWWSRGAAILVGLGVAAVNGLVLSDKGNAWVAKIHPNPVEWLKWVKIFSNSALAVSLVVVPPMFAGIWKSFVAWIGADADRNQLAIERAALTARNVLAHECNNLPTRGKNWQLHARNKVLSAVVSFLSTVFASTLPKEQIQLFRVRIFRVSQGKIKKLVASSPANIPMKTSLDVVKADDSLASRAMLSKETIIVEDIAKDQLSEKAFRADPMNKAGAKGSLIVHPVVKDGTGPVLYVITVHNSVGHTFRKRDLEFYKRELELIDAYLQQHDYVGTDDQDSLIGPPRP
ncbi:hypothetical protein EON81_04260 [bacterium]|nr:MAG: hypothetical protein EON81_04260 [bacterium]